MIIFLFCNGCAVIFQDTGLYKLAAGFGDVTHTEGKEIIVVRYWGKKNESKEKALIKWKKRANNVCGKYKVTSQWGSPFVNAESDLEFIDGIYVYFAKNKRWPQVYGEIKCS